MAFPRNGWRPWAGHFRGAAAAHRLLYCIAMRGLLLICVLLLAAPAAAQRRGSVRIVGYVSQTASLQFHAASTFGDGVAGANSGGDGEALDYTLDLGDVGKVPGRDNAMRGASIVLALRTNAAYTLTATVVSSGFSPGPSQVQLSDIGFGVPSAEIVATGERASAARTAVLNRAKFDADPSRAPVVGGAPKFSGTLEDLRSEVPLLHGDAVSRGGTLHSPDNALLVSTKYAILPQYFEPNAGFSAVIVYTLTTP